MPDGEVRWIDSEQEAHDHFDFLQSCREADRFDAILEVEYANFRQNSSTATSRNGVKKGRHAIYGIDQVRKNYSGAAFYCWL